MRRQAMFALLGVGLVLEGCNCAGREFTLRKTFAVTSGAEDALCDTKTVKVDMRQETAFNDVRQYVTRVELRKLAVEVTAVNPPAETTNRVTKAGGEVIISASDTDTRLVLGTYQDVPITVGARQDITIDQTAANTLSQLMLRSPNIFWAFGKGCNDQVPAYYEFDAILTLYAGLD